MEQKIEKSNNNGGNFWKFTIALITIVLIVLAGGAIVILVQGGHSISGKEAVEGAAFPWIFFIPIWVMLAKKKKRPTLKQERVIKAMIILALILLIINVLVFWLL